MSVATMGNDGANAGGSHWAEMPYVILSPFVSTEKKASRAAALVRDSDPGRLVPLLDRCGLLALAGWELSCLLAPGDKVAPYDLWRRVYIRDTAGGIQQVERLRAILDAAGHAGIPLLNLCAPYLVERAYEGQYGLRAPIELDFAIPPDNTAALLELLHDTFHDAHIVSQNGRHDAAKTLSKSRIQLIANGVPINLHWDLTALKPFHNSTRCSNRQGAVWNRSVEGTFSWGTCRALSDADLLLHIAEHLVLQHGSCGRALLGLVDFARTYAVGKVDIGILERVAHERGATTALRAVASGLCEFLYVPEDFKDFRRLAGRGGTAALTYGTRRFRAVVQRTFLEESTQPLARPGSPIAAAERIESVATFADCFGMRLAVIRTLLFPNRKAFSGLLDRSLSMREYVVSLPLAPLVRLAVRQMLRTVARRQMEDSVLVASRRLREALYALVAIAFVARYYAANPRDTGLLGRGALSVWRQRLTLSWPDARNICDRPIWLHLAGPGDARAGKAFVEALSEHLPDTSVLITCGTRSTADYVRKEFTGQRFRWGWMPFDIPGVTRRWLRRLNPRAFVGMQGELWPNLLRELARRGAPSILLRVDMLDWDTQEEFPSWVRPLYEKMLAYVDQFSVRVPLYGRRLIESGVEEGRVSYGNDYRLIAPPPPTPDERVKRYAELFVGASRLPLLVVAGPRSDEAAKIVDALNGIAIGVAFRLLLAPVRIDVCSRIERDLLKKSYRVVRRSRMTSFEGDGQIILLDTHGELADIYSVAALAIVGDTFPSSFAGGVNLWESLMKGTPVVYGPALLATTVVCQMETAGVAHRILEYGDMAQTVKKVLANPPERSHVREIALSAAAGFGAAAARDVEIVVRMLLEESSEGGRHRLGRADTSPSR